MATLSDHVSLLGAAVRDRVTGFVGVVSTVGFDLYGCIQAVVTPPAKDGETKDGKWFDIGRLVVTDSARVMPVPDFTKFETPAGEFQRGPAEKPHR